MAQLTPAQFSTKWIPLLANNVFQEIDGPRLGELITDIKDSFADAAALRVPTAPDYDPDTVYAQGNLVLYGQPKRWFEARVAGLLPAPVPGQETTEWQPIAPPLSPLLPYREMSVGQAQDYASEGSLQPGTLYRLSGRVDDNGSALDDVLAVAMSRHYLAGADAYVAGTDAQTREEYLHPVSYDLATDATSARTGGGGGGFTEAQVQDIAAQQLVAAQQNDISITRNQQTRQLIISSTPASLKELYFDHPASGTGNVLRRFFRLRYPIQEGAYSWVNDQNVDRVELSYASGTVIFSGTIAQFRSERTSFLYTEQYGIVLYPLDVTQPVSLELVEQ